MGSLHSLELGPYKAHEHLQVLQLHKPLGACSTDVGVTINKRPQHLDRVWLAYGQGRRAQATWKSRGAQSVQVLGKLLFKYPYSVPLHPRSASVQEISKHVIEAQVSFLMCRPRVQRFVSLIISQFQNINPEKEGKTVNGPADVKSELRMITVEDNHFSMWKEFIERHHWGKLIDLDSGEVFKEKKPFILSSKFQLTREFFKYFGHFIDNDFKVYVQHLLGRTTGRVSAYPKVTVHKTNHVHASYHTRHEWVERRKLKRVILEELVEL